MHLSPRQAATGALAMAALGCGAGPQTLHPAHAIAQGRVVLGAGVSGNFALGDVKTKIDQAGTIPQGSDSAAAEQAYVDGAVARAMTGPGVGPWAGGRVGVGYDSEAELTYAGRSMRAGARHAFEDGEWAVSVGAGGSVVLLHPESHPPDPTPTATVGRFESDPADLSVTGWGLDVPVVAGFRSDGEVVQAWIGARGGLESVVGDLPLVPGVASNGARLAQRANVEGTRWYAGGLVGIAVGLDPVWVGVQLDSAYQSVSGSVTTDDAVDALDLSVDVTGLTLTPTGVLWGKF